MELHVETEWIVDQLRWLPETELDACLAFMTAATGGVHWAAKDVRYEAAVLGGQEIWLKRGGEKLGGRVDGPRRGIAERVLADWSRDPSIL